MDVGQKQPGEEIVFQELGVAVTRSRLVLPNQAIAIGLITSVQVTRKKRPLRLSLLLGS